MARDKKLNNDKKLKKAKGLFRVTTLSKKGAGTD